MPRRAETPAPDPLPPFVPTMPDDCLVRRRLTLHIYGYWRTDPLAFHRRFARDLDTFARTWALSTEIGPASLDADHAGWRTRVRGEGIDAQTDFRVLRLDAMIAARQRRPLVLRLGLGFYGLLDFVASRAFLGYLRLRWPYAMLTALPLILAAMLGLLAVWGGRIAGADNVVLGVAAAAALWITGFALCLKPFRILEMLDNWAFASRLARGLEPALERSIEGAARDLTAEGLAGAYDEILVIGHSLGAVLALHLAERLAERTRPAAAGAVRGLPHEGEPRFGLLTVGSSLLKIGLHPAATDLRRATARVVATPSIVWADYQSRLDVMGFHGHDPVSAMGLPAPHPPIVRTAPFSRMLGPQAYRRLRFDPFRIHNQYVRANDRRCAYDYFMFACGPFRFGDLARSKGGALYRIGDGGAPCRQAPTTQTSNGAGR